MTKETTSATREWWSSLTRAERDNYMRKHRTEVDKVFGIEHEQPASVTGREAEQSQLFSRYTFAVVTGRYKILDNRSDGPVRIAQIATADGEVEARTIVRALNNHEQNERLREALRRIQAWLEPAAVDGLTLKDIREVVRAALNHGEQGEVK